MANDLIVDLDLFLSRHLAALEKDQAKYNLMLGLLNRARPKSYGQCRFAQIDDKQTYIDWTIHFCIETNGERVSMASRTHKTKDGSNISLVYTPPQFRARDYGGSVTALACEHAFSDGKKLCFAMV